MARLLRSVMVTMVAAGFLTASVLTGTAAAASGGCDLYASPSGSDSGTGQVNSPLATVQALDYALAPGQTGCLQAGSYGSISTITYLGNSGTPSGQITIAPAPGQTAKITGL